MKVIDNITTPANAEHLKHLLLGEPWYYLKSTAYNADDSTGGIPYETSWILMIHDNQEIMRELIFESEENYTNILALAKEHENDIN